MHRLVLLALFSASMLQAQAIVSLGAGQCVWHNGDNPAWADPILDESLWHPFTQWRLDPHQPNVWMRCHASVSALAGTPSPAVQLDFPAAWELYANGVLIGISGDLSSGHYPTYAIRIFPSRRSWPRGRWCWRCAS